MSAEELIRAYGTTYDELRLGVAGQAEQLWLELGGPDDRRLNDFAEAAEELVNDANRATGQLVTEYVDEYVGTVSRRPPPPRSSAGEDALDLAELAVDQLRGITDSYRRPGIAVRKGLADGKLYEVVMREQATRINAQAQADVALAHRYAARSSMERHELTFYRRVLTAESCDLCRVAATQRYRTGDLMPIHSRCDCRVAPLVGDYDGARIVNRELYRELKLDGTLDRVNRNNAGQSGRARARRAQRNRDRAGRAAGNRRRQGRLDGLEELELELPPIEAPAVRQHGELGPVLVNERHRFTAAKRTVDEVTDASDLRTRPPAVVVEEVVEEVVDAPVEAVAKAERSGRWTKDTPSVIRAAQRRNVSPEQIIDELELKRADRLAEQRAERELRRQLTDVDSDEVRKLADAYDVTPDEIVANVAKVPQARRTMSDAATKVQLDAFETLDTWDARKLGRPRRTRGKLPPEWDWLSELDDAEVKRLRRSWFDDPEIFDPPDVLADRIGNALSTDLSVDDAIARRWLEQTRRYEAAGSIRRGKAPSARAYSGRVDVDGLLEGAIDDADEFTLRPSEVVGRSDGDVAGRLAQLARTADRADAELYLDDALRATTGDPPPWRMSFQSFEAELRDLESGLRNTPADVRPDGVDRLRELVPTYLDDDGTSYEELYGRIIDTARRAGQDVPDYARIPWEAADGLPTIDELYGALL